MRNWVNEWVQDGRVCIWRYADPRRGWRGWQFAADPAGCRSVRNLLDRMHAGEPCHRTLKLEPVTDAILSVPNYGRKGSGPKLKPGMTLAIEPMVNMGSSGVRVLPDKWTVVSADGSLTAHFEHSVAVTEGEPLILTVP